MVRRIEIKSHVLYRACVLVLAATALLFFLAGCGSTPQATPSATSTDATVSVVAAEDFWGSIAAQIGGTHAHVVDIIDNPDTDPHDYQPVTQDARLVADAQYVISNGAGYDPWMEQLLSANPNSNRKSLSVGDLVGKKAGDNPHLWYNPAYVTQAAAKIRDDLKAIDPADAASFDQNEKNFLTNGLGQYNDLISAIKATYSGTPVGSTESIFAYMAPALGLDLITPASYMNAVSEGTDISAVDEATVERQITEGQIKVLVYNSQNTPPNIQSLLQLARTNNIPVATITETLTPVGASFQEWQVRQLQGIQDALHQGTGK